MAKLRADKKNYKKHLLYTQMHMTIGIWEVIIVEG